MIGSDLLNACTLGEPEGELAIVLEIFRCPKPSFKLKLTGLLTLELSRILINLTISATGSIFLCFEISGKAF